jgi:hypothetical protein
MALLATQAGLISTTLQQATSSPSPNELSFSDPSTLFNHATRNWQTNYVTTALHSAEIIEPFVKRPFFLLVGVDGPIGTRYKRERRRWVRAMSSHECVKLIPVDAQTSTRWKRP